MLYWVEVLVGPGLHYIMFVVVVHGQCHLLCAEELSIKYLGLSLTSLVCLGHLQERKLDEKLPLLFADKKYPANEVQVSATGVQNGVAIYNEDEAKSSSTVAVGYPTGMILEQESQAGASGPMSDPEDEALVVTVKSSDDKPSPTPVSQHSNCSSFADQPNRAGKLGSLTFESPFDRANQQAWVLLS
jgi:hypothetical protein